MEWIQNPEIINPDDACGAHLCSANEGGSCIIRICLTRYCPIDL